jgi:hypothetical protein
MPFREKCFRNLPALRSSERSGQFLEALLIYSSFNYPIVQVRLETASPAGSSINLLERTDSSNSIG